MPGRMQLFHSLNEIAKIGNHLRRTAGEVDDWNVGLCQPIGDPIDCLTGHDLLALRPRVHVTVHAGEIAKLAHVHLKDLRTRAAKRERMRIQFLSEAIHQLCCPAKTLWQSGPIILTGSVANCFFLKRLWIYGGSELRINAIINPKLLSELFCCLRLAFRDVAAGQSPRTLGTEWHCQKFP